MWRAAYNPVYDSLLASCSSDCCVNLYYTPNLAAGPVAGTGAEAGAAVGGVSTAAAGAAQAGAAVPGCTVGGSTAAAQHKVPGR